MTGFLRIGEVSRQTGLTIRQLRYLARLHVAPTAWVGTHRAYGPRQLRQLAIVKELLEKGYRPLELANLLAAQQTVLQSPPSDEQVFTQLLEQTPAGQQFRVDVGTDPQRYNTAYKVLRRLARRLKRPVRLSKNGADLDVHVLPSVKASRTNAVARSRKAQRSAQTGKKKLPQRVPRTGLGRQ